MLLYLLIWASFSLKVKKLAKDDGMCMSRNWSIIAKRMNGECALHKKKYCIPFNM